MYQDQVQIHIQAQPEDSAVDQFADIILASSPSTTPLDSLATSLQKEGCLDKKHSKTGATLLGLAITLLKPEAVLVLLNAGADVNLVTGLKGKEDYLPLAIAIIKLHPEKIEDFYLDEQKILASSILLSAISFTDLW